MNWKQKEAKLKDDGEKKWNEKLEGKSNTINIDKKVRKNKK